MRTRQVRHRLTTLRWRMCGSALAAAICALPFGCGGAPKPEVENAVVVAAATSSSASSTEVPEPRAGVPAPATLEVALEQFSKADAPGAVQQGPDGAAEVGPDEPFVMPIQMQPNGCYTIVVVSEEIAELEATISLNATPNTAVPLPPMLLAKGVGTPQHTAIGAGANCFRVPFPLPLPVLLRVVAQRGRGPVRVRVMTR